MKKFLLGLLIVLSLLGVNSSITMAENTVPAKSPRPAQVLIFMIDRLDVGDLEPGATPNLWRLMQKGAIGLLNAPSAGERNTSNTCCTISAGQRVLSSAHASYNFEAGEYVNGEKAGDVFFRNTGIKPATDNLVASNIELIKNNNVDKNLDLPGLLGDELHELGCPTAVIGNSDLPGYYSRNGILMLMDSNGIVDSGKVGKEMTVPSIRLPWQTNYQQVLKQSNAIDNSVLLVEFGDLSRLDSMAHLYSPSSLAKERKSILAQVDNCVGKIVKQKGQTLCAIYIISPTPSKSVMERGELLTPLIIVKPGMKGVLTGISTRREGVVSSLVIKNSILASLNPNQEESISSSALPDSYGFISGLNRELAFGYVNQKWFMPIVVAIIIILLGLALILQKRKFSQSIINYILIFIISVPLTLLLIANFGVLKPIALVLIFLAFNFLEASLSYLFARWKGSNHLSPILLATIVCISLDLFFKLGMLEKSMMSYRIMAGSRYYGLGNEYMGVLLAAAIVYSAILLQSNNSVLRRRITGILFCIVIFLNAYPRLGTKVGGTITAAIALGYTYMHYRHQRMDARKIIFLAVGTVILLAIMALIDLRQPIELQSHLGRNITLVMNGGINEALIIIQRKMQMQWRVLNFTIWAWILFFSVIAATYAVFNPGTMLSPVKRQFPYIYSGLKGLTIAAVTAIIFNDSGITAAASLFIFSTIMMIYYWKMDPSI